MNIFYLSHDTEQCAVWHVDAHVRKMPFEYAQLLTSAHFILNRTPQAHEKSTTSKDEVYGYQFPKSVPSHPCAIWVRKSRAHYDWLYSLLLATCAEYQHRYGVPHYIERWGALARLRTPPLALRQPESNTHWSAPPQAMPDECKQRSCILAYRSYYRTHKRYDKAGRLMHKWTKRRQPKWIKQDDTVQKANAV
jgi:hypothetical protein